MRVLLIEDDKILASFVVKGLKEAGYAVDSAEDGETGFYLLSSEPYDAAIVDIMLPKMDGFSLVDAARKQAVKTPVIFLSAKREADDRIKGFQIGGDDYLVKPFVFAELLARLQAQIGRSSNAVPAMSLSVGDLEMDLAKHRVSRADQAIELKPREFKLLEYLMRNAGRVVSKTMIMQHVWDYDFDPETNVVEVSVSRLRSELNKGFDEKILRTVRGFGYVLDNDA
ncbi:MAG: response regulator transcription factor [bacterium]